MKGKLLFVYGTMLQKGRNHSRLYEAQAIFLGQVQTIDRFRLYVREHNGAPIAIRDCDGHPIRGELYAIPEVNIDALIDPMEGHPEHYRREPITLAATDDFWGLVVETYVYQHPPGKQDRKVRPHGRGVLAYEPE